MKGTGYFNGIMGMSLVLQRRPIPLFWGFSNLTQIGLLVGTAGKQIPQIELYFERAVLIYSYQTWS